MNLAKILNLPVLFVLEDNGYAETTASGWAVAGRPVELTPKEYALRKRRFAESRYGRATSTARAWIGIATGAAAVVVGAAFWISTAGKA